MDIFAVAFFGHRYIDNFFDVEAKLEKLITDLLRSKQYVEFLVGRNGDFDQMVSSTVLRVRRNIGEENSSLVLVLPNMTAEFENNHDSFLNYYSDVEICEEASTAYFKNAIQIRNRCMVDRADMVVCYIEHDKGGAFQTVQYAEKQKKEIVNLFECR